MKRFIMLSLTILTLTGCVELISRASVEAGYLATAASNIAHENHLVRQWVRGQCLEIFKDRIRKLLGEGKPDEATVLLIAGYPSLVTVSILKKVYKNQESILSVPFGCAVLPESSEAPVTPEAPEAPVAVDDLS